MSQPFLTCCCGGNLVVGGDFTSAAGAPTAKAIAALVGTHYDPVGDPIPLPQPLSVFHIGRAGATLLIQARSGFDNHAFRLAGDTWTPIPLTPVGASFGAFLSHQGYLWAFGNCSSIAGVPTPSGSARTLDGQTWIPIPSSQLLAGGHLLSWGTEIIRHSPIGGAASAQRLTSSGWSNIANATDVFHGMTVWNNALWAFRAGTSQFGGLYRYQGGTSWTRETTMASTISSTSATGYLGVLDDDLHIMVGASQFGGQPLTNCGVLRWSGVGTPTVIGPASRLLGFVSLSINFGGDLYWVGGSNNQTHMVKATPGGAVLNMVDVSPQASTLRAAA